ncbi:hypothetical protein ACLB6M_06215 [Enterobacter hormaechei]
MIQETISRLIFMLDGGEFKPQQLFPASLSCAAPSLTARIADVDIVIVTNDDDRSSSLFRFKINVLNIGTVYE